MDMTKIATAAAGGGTFAAAVQDLQGTGVMIQKNFGEWIKLGAGDIEAKLAETTTKLAEAGTTIKTINDAVPDIVISRRNYTSIYYTNKYN